MNAGHPASLIGNYIPIVIRMTGISLQEVYLLNPDFMKKKEKKKSPQQLKQEELHLKNCYLKRIKAMMGIMGDESAYELLSPKGVERLYLLRQRPVKLISPDDPKQKVPKHDLDIMNYELHQILQQSFVEFYPEKKQVSLYDFKFFFESLYLFQLNVNKDSCLDPQAFKEKLPAFNDDYEQIRLDAHTKLLDSLDLVAWFYSDTVSHNIRMEQETINDKNSPSERVALFNNYVVHFEKPETELFEIDGHKRTIFQVGIFRRKIFNRMVLTPEQLGIPDRLQQMPMKVYIQTHAIERIKERIGAYFMGLHYMEIFTSFLTQKPFRSDDGGFLFPYFYLYEKLG
jgi:hypothetical protein